MKPKLRRLLIPFLAVLLLLQGCASYSRVRELKPHKARAGGETAAALQTAAGLAQMKREPLVAVRREPRPDAWARFSLPRAYYGVTAVARFKGRRCEIKFEDPLGDEEVSMDGRRYPLAAGHCAPPALMLTDGEPEKQEIRNLLRPADRESARIVRTQPFDPNKTTVLVVHGLAASPATWVPMLNALRGDAAILRGNWMPSLRFIRSGSR